MSALPVRPMAVLLLLAFAVPAFAGGADAPAHGEDAAHEDGGDAHHVTYTDDADGDGAPNWRDPDSGVYVVPNLLQHLFNLAIFGALVATFVRRPAADALKNRASTIRIELEEAAKVRDEARREHDELKRRLEGFSAEIEQMKQVALREIALDEQRLVQRAHEAADRVRETAQRNIREETVRARQSLRAEAVELAVQLAEQALRGQVQSEDHRRLAREFLTSLEGSDGRG